MSTMITIATDGSCLKNPGGATGWAWIDDTYRWDGGGSIHPRGTNQIAELRAFFEALRAHRDDPEITVLSDSEYALNCATQWRRSWERRNGLTTSGTQVRYYRNIQQIWLLLDERGDRSFLTKLEWIRGHSGHILNEQADIRANKAAKLARKAGRDLVRSELNIPDPVPRKASFA